MPGPTLTNPGYQFDTGLVSNPAQAQNQDNNPSPMLIGRHGDLLVSRIHTESYVSRARGNGFSVSSGAAGVAAFAAPAGTTGSWVLYNPVGSGVLIDIEEIAFTNPTSTQTQIIAGMAVEGSLQTPTGTLTKATPNSFPLGAARGSPQLITYSAGPTIVAMTYLMGLGLNITSTAGFSSPAVRSLSGKLLFAPGYCINIVSTLVQTSEHLGVDVFWSEWPI